MYKNERLNSGYVHVRSRAVGTFGPPLSLLNSPRQRLLLVVFVDYPFRQKQGQTHEAAR